MEECIDETSSPEERTEENDVKDKEEKQEEEEQQTTEGIANESIQADDSTVFHKICYLGAETIGNPKDEPLIQGQIKAANEAKPASSEATEYVELSVPRTSEGWVVMRALDPARPTSPDEKDAAKLLLHAGEDDGGGKVLLRLPICRIIFFGRSVPEICSSPTRGFKGTVTGSWPRPSRRVRPPCWSNGAPRRRRPVRTCG